VEANRLLAGPATHVLLDGGSRSGKTMLFCRGLIIRAAKAPESTHVIFRKHFNHLKFSIIFDTMPKALQLFFPELEGQVRLSKTDWFHEFPNGSRTIYAGLDDKERTEKVLGQEHSTLFFNECPQISYASRNKALTRLAQNAGLKLRAWYDGNPTVKSSWIYKVFVLHIDPSSGEPFANPGDYARLPRPMNPADNERNLAPEYIAQLAALPERDRRRFLHGEWDEGVPNALWKQDGFQRVAPIRTAEEREQMKAKLRRVVVSVDPSGGEDEDDLSSDEIGLAVTGVDKEGVGYVLEDWTGHYSPRNWGRKAVELFDLWGADLIVAERNYGGEMVRFTIQAARPNVPVKLVTASRGKHVRAEPVASLYEQGRVKHAGRFPDLEDELCQFSTAGYAGERSPNRADVMVFGLTELMLDPESTYTLDNVI
jgi:hypothetical protein